MLVTTFLLFSLPPAPTAPTTPITPIAPTIARAARTSHNSYFSPPLSPSHFANSLIIPTFALCKEYSP